MIETLRDALRDPAGSGIFLDFDGTLSEIVATPAEARALEGVSRVLPRLAARYRVVAIVSGRRAGDVARLLDVDAASRVRCFGLYGLEDLGGPSSGAMTAAEHVERVWGDVERAAAFVPGSLVEHKGLQVAVHYRGAADHDAARHVLLERLARVAADAGMRLLEGKRVIELAPARGPTKGDVVRSTARDESLGAVLYAGDDVADLEAFAAVDVLSAEGVRGVKVAVRSAETPVEVLDAADAVVDGPRGLLVLLERISAA